MKYCLLFAQFFILNVLLAQYPILVKDINPGSANSKTPTVNDNKFYTEINGGLLFTADDGVNGNELWFSDGTDAGTFMIKDINTGSASSNIGTFFKFNNKCYFVANSVGYGEELWVTDGTTLGTTLIKDVRSGSVGGSISNFFDINNGYFLFTANNGVNGLELWKSDGTPSGTNMLIDIFPGAGSGTPTSFKQNSLGMIFFVANDGTTGQELWCTDVSVTTASLMKDVKIGTPSSNPQNLFIVNDKCFFTADDGIVGNELYVSSGTPGTTIFLKDIYTGSSSSSYNSFIGYNNKLVFKAYDGTIVSKVWESDGTPIGTISFSFPPDVNTSYIFGIINGKVVFTAKWCYSGCMPGAVDSTFVYAFTNSVLNTTVINKFKSKNDPGGAAGGVIPLNNKLLFYTLSNVGAWSGSESYFVLSDGSVAGTTKVFVGNSYWASGSSSSEKPPVINNKVLLSVMTRPSFVDDLGDFTMSNDYVCNGYYFYKAAKLGNKLFFSAGDASTGNEIWETDGTVANTYLNFDLNPGNVGSVYAATGSNYDAYFNPYVTSTNKLFFYATDGATGYELFVINGISTDLKGTNEVNKTLSVFPNPNTGEFRISSEIKLEKQNIKFFDLLGKKIDFETGANNTIRLQNVSSGIYFYKINSLQKEITGKLIIND